MIPPLRRLFVGPPDDRFQRSLDLLLAAALFVATYAAYAVGVFGVSGGVVFVPGDAALVALLGAGLVGYRRSGLAIAWLVAYAPFLGYRADHAFLGLSYRSFGGQFAYFVEPEGLAVLAAQAIVLGTVAFAAGSLLGRGVGFLREETAANPSE